MTGELIDVTMIKPTVLISVILISLSSTAFGQDKSISKQELVPGREAQLTFPDLAKTFRAQIEGPDNSATVTFRLPDNYKAVGSFPMFVYLAGGTGGSGDNLDLPRKVIGDNDYIVVTMPLFRKPEFKRDTVANGLVIGTDDYATMAPAYKTILKRLHEVIPNIDKSRSILGGHSNGAHTIGVLLSALDQPTLDSFGGFFFVDGGLEWSSYKRTRDLDKHHVMFMIGGGKEKPHWTRRYLLFRLEMFQKFSEEHKMAKWSFKVMLGHGHEFSEDYYNVIRDWAKSVDRNKLAQKSDGD